MEKNKLVCISLGAGVQSSTMALMAERGEILPKPDCAIFADTQWEPKAVYDWLGWLETRLSYPVYRVTGGNIRDNIVNKSNPDSEKRFTSIPFFVISPNGEKGMGRRQCTNEYKLKPIEKKQRELLGYAPRKRIPRNSLEVWIGISTDEVSRMKESYVKWKYHRWPLIEKRMNRNDCLIWMRKNYGKTPPKSSCLGCPFHSGQMWREIKKNPDEWRDVLEIDEVIRKPVRGFRGQQFLHSSCIPLKDVDLSTEEERGQLNLFENECAGICGV